MKKPLSYITSRAEQISSIPFISHILSFQISQQISQCLIAGVSRVKFMHQSGPQTIDYKMCYQVAIGCGFSHRIVPTYVNIYAHGYK